MCSVLYVHMCIYALGLFWGLVLDFEPFPDRVGLTSEFKAVFFPWGKKREDCIELSSLQHMTCSSVCASPMVVLLASCLILN